MQVVSRILGNPSHGHSEALGFGLLSQEQRTNARAATCQSGVLPGSASRALSMPQVVKPTTLEKMKPVQRNLAMGASAPPGC
jgi:hypothetical protein